MSASLISSTRGLVVLTKTVSGGARSHRLATCQSAIPVRRSQNTAPALALSFGRVRDVVARATGSASPTTPIVKIDNMSDSFATIISVECGENLGEMLSTISALKNIGLNIRRAKLGQSSNVNKFYVTEKSTSEKIVKSARLEEIRLTVLGSLINDGVAFTSYNLTGNPSSNQMSAMGRRELIPTVVDVSEAPEGSCSVLKVITADRPGLLVDIVHVLKDINLNVVSAEVDTIGAQAVDIFFITYRGEPLSDNMITLTVNALQYHLALSEIEEDSY